MPLPSKRIYSHIGLKRWGKKRFGFHLLLKMELFHLKINEDEIKLYFHPM
jgi:hypothetical protein